MNNLLNLIMVLMLYSVITQPITFSHNIDGSFYVYQDLYNYKQHLTAYKSSYFNGNLDYRTYEAHENLRNGLLLKYSKCNSVTQWIEKGETMVRALNSRAIQNEHIYPVYWTKLINLARDCQ